MLLRRPEYTPCDIKTTTFRIDARNFAFLINWGTVSWSPRKQKLVTLSTAEAEYITTIPMQPKRLSGPVAFSLNSPPSCVCRPPYTELPEQAALRRSGSSEACRGRQLLHVDQAYRRAVPLRLPGCCKDDDRRPHEGLAFLEGAIPQIFQSLGVCSAEGV